MNLSAQSWFDIQNAQNIDPKSIVYGATLNATAGTFSRSTNCLQAAWSASPLAFTGNNTKVTSLDTTDAATTVDANQWTFSHQMVNVAAGIPPAMNKVVFLRSGANWDCAVEINMFAVTYNNVQLTFRDNLGTTGMFLNSATGAVPVISFGNGLTGLQVLHLNLTQPGVYSMVLVAQNSGSGLWSAFEMEWVVIP